MTYLHICYTQHTLNTRKDRIIKTLELNIEHSAVNKTPSHTAEWCEHEPDCPAFSSAFTQEQITLEVIKELKYQ